jgi:hypothetical protein
MKKLLMAVLGLTTLTLVGCIEGKYTGGGWTESITDPDAKATFAGNFEAIDADGDGEVFDFFSGTFDLDDTFKGQFQYNDHGTADVAFHGTVTNGYLMTDPTFIAVFPADRPSDYNVPGAIYFEGTYRPVGKSEPGDEGTFEVMVIDNGEPGPSEGDTIWVACTSGKFAGYTTDLDVFLGGLAWDDDIFGQPLRGGNIQFHPPE